MPFESLILDLQILELYAHLSCLSQSVLQDLLLALELDVHEVDLILE